jgi:hypothetical protein
MCQNLMNIYFRSISATRRSSRESFVSATVQEIIIKIKQPFHLNEVHTSFANETTSVPIILVQ